jgi:hypothetical protein
MKQTMLPRLNHLWNIAVRLMPDPSVRCLQIRQLAPLNRQLSGFQQTAMAKHTTSHECSLTFIEDFARLAHFHFVSDGKQAPVPVAIH